MTMLQQEEVPKVPVVRFNDVDYPLVGELTYREMVEAEQLAGDINKVGTVTTALLLAYFTVKRAGQLLSWDALLDGAAVIEQVPSPLADGDEDNAPESTLGHDGQSPTLTPSESTPG